jgi:hypothetical protein
MRTPGYQALIPAPNGARKPWTQATAKPWTRGKEGREAVRRLKTDGSACGAAMALRSVLVRAAEDFRRRCVAQSLARTFRSPFATAGFYFFCFLVFVSVFFFFFFFFFCCRILVSLFLSLSSCSFLFSTAVLYVCSLSLFSFLHIRAFVDLVLGNFRCCFSVSFSVLFLLSCGNWSFHDCSLFSPVGSGRFLDAPSSFLLNLVVWWRFVCVSFDLRYLFLVSFSSLLLPFDAGCFLLCGAVRSSDRFSGNEKEVALRLPSLGLLWSFGILSLTRSRAWGYRNPVTAVSGCLSVSTSLHLVDPLLDGLAVVLDDLKYAESHEWVKLEGDYAVVGITHHAQVCTSAFPWTPDPAFLKKEDAFVLVGSECVSRCCIHHRCRSVIDWLLSAGKTCREN